MAELMVYTAVPSRGAVRWMLEEVGEPYDASRNVAGSSPIPSGVAVQT